MLQALPAIPVFSGAFIFIFVITNFVRVFALYYTWNWLCPDIIPFGKITLCNAIILVFVNMLMRHNWIKIESPKEKY